VRIRGFGDSCRWGSTGVMKRDKEHGKEQRMIDLGNLSRKPPVGDKSR
jgi:hypothetical protein